jgi:hypothetical protein
MAITLGLVNSLLLARILMRPSACAFHAGAGDGSLTIGVVLGLRVRGAMPRLLGVEVVFGALVAWHRHRRYASSWITGIDVRISDVPLAKALLLVARWPEMAAR